MATIQIRDVPEEDYDVLREAARAEGKSLQAYMREQTSVMASRAKKRAAFDAVRESLHRHGGSGVTRESILRDLDEIRGRLPGEQDASAGDQ